MRKYGYAAWQKWLSAGRPEPPPPEDDPDEDQAGDGGVQCHACGAKVSGSACAECGSPVTPTAGRLLVRLASSTYGIAWVPMIVLVPAAIVLYAVSPEGQSRLPLLLALILGPVAVSLVAWYGYRRWYRSRYPED